MSEIIYSCDVHDQVDAPIETHPYCLGLASRDAHLELDIWLDLEKARLVKLGLFQRVYLAPYHKGVSIVEKGEYSGLRFILV